MRRDRHDADIGPTEPNYSCAKITLHPNVGGARVGPARPDQWGGRAFRRKIKGVEPRNVSMPLPARPARPHLAPSRMVKPLISLDACIRLQKWESPGLLLAWLSRKVRAASAGW
jgi:hypothetical protein